MKLSPAAHAAVAHHGHGTFGIGRFVVQRGKEMAGWQGQQAGDQLDHAAAGPQVAEVALGGHDRERAAPGRRRPSWIARASSTSQLRVLRPWACRWPTSSGVASAARSTARSTLAMACWRRATSLRRRPPSWRPRRAPRRRSWRRGPGPWPSSSSITAPAPSPRTMPVRLRSKGRLSRVGIAVRRRPVPLAGGSGRSSWSAAACRWPRRAWRRRCRGG